jgi:hypothetical protein
MASYDALSDLVGSHPDLLILRRFGTLNAQILLRMQAELLEIANDMEHIRLHEETSPQTEKRQHSRSWKAAQDAYDTEGQGSWRVAKIKEAEDKLTRYCMLISIYLVLTLRLK